MRKISIATSALVLALAAAGGASAKAPTMIRGECQGGIANPCGPIPPLVGGKICAAKVGTPCHPVPPIKKKK